MKKYILLLLAFTHIALNCAQKPNVVLKQIIDKDIYYVEWHLDGTKTVVVESPALDGISGNVLDSKTSKQLARLSPDDCLAQYYTIKHLEFFPEKKNPSISWGIKKPQLEGNDILNNLPNDTQKK